MQPSDRIFKELFSENANVWYYSEGDTSKIIVKLPSNVIKAIGMGCKVEFLFGRDYSSSRKYIHNGIRIYDDPIHFLTVSGTLRFEDEYNSLSKIAILDSVLVEFYDELALPVASATVSFKNYSKKIIEFLNDVTLLYIGDFDDSAAASLNCFDYSLDKSRTFSDVYEIDVLRIDGLFNNWNASNLHFAGLNEVNHLTIDDEDEGGLLEKQAWASLESVFYFDLHKNPILKKGNKSRELTDIIAYHSLGIFLIESKCLSVMASEADKSMSKKISTLKKHIRKAIKQLIGAKKNLDKGEEIYDSKGRPIKFDRNIIPHCIVLVSELFPFDDWQDIFIESCKAMIDEKIYLHILSLGELATFLKAAKGRKEHFDYLLMLRSEAILEAKTLLINPVFHIQKPT